MQKIYILEGYQSCGECIGAHSYAFFSETSAIEERDILNETHALDGVEFVVRELTVKESNSTNFIKLLK